MVTPSTASTSIAGELLANDSPYRYKEMLPFIHENDAVRVETYKNSKLSEYFRVDTSRAFKNGRANPQHLFELFGEFSSHEPNNMRILMLKSIAKNLRFHQRRSLVILEMRNTNFDVWVDQMGNNHRYCDELGLLTLCSLYHRHAMVLMANKLWSTIEHNQPLNLLELLNECSVKLVYLIHLRFGELKPIHRLVLP